MSEVGDLQDEIERCREAAEWADDMRKNYKEQLDDALGLSAELLEALKDLVYAAPLPLEEKQKNWDNARAVVAKADVEPISVSQQGGTEG